MTEISEFARRTYRSVHGQTESLFELWHGFDHMKVLGGPADIMNRVAPNLFGTLHRCMLQSVLLLIRQLTDPPASKVRGVLRPNSSMRGLLQIAFGNGYESVMPELAETIDRATRAGVAAREWANKAVAHTDLLTGLDDEPLPKLHWGALPTCVETIVQFVQQFEAATNLPRSPFAKSVLGEQVEVVARVLRAGVAGDPPIPLPDYGE